MEGDDELFGHGSREVGRDHRLLEVGALVAGGEGEEQPRGCVEAEGRRRVGGCLGAPCPHHERGGEYVLVAHAIVCLERAVSLAHAHGTLRGGVNLDTHHHESAVYPEGGYADLLRWIAVHLGGLLDHVDVFLGAHACDVAVVLDSYQKAPARVVGECREGARYLARVGDGKLEVLLLVLALFDERGDVEGSLYAFQVFHSAG